MNHLLNAGLRLAAREDPLRALNAEADLPVNATLEEAELSDPAARAAVARSLAGELATPVGYVLPVRRPQAKSEGNGWLSQAWTFRRRNLFLVPGDSPAGMLRLPLASLPVVAPKDFPFIVPRDPFEATGPLPTFDHIRATPGADPTPIRVARRRAKAPIVRTALVIEARDGVLHVFMPPTAAVEDYLELVAQAEAATEGLPLVFEGYPPPDDARVAVLKVTPDPGVIEVNVQPAASWRETVAITTGRVYGRTRRPAASGPTNS